jgi:membrane protein
VAGSRVAGRTLVIPAAPTAAPLAGAAGTITRMLAAAGSLRLRWPAGRGGYPSAAPGGALLAARSGGERGKPTELRVERRDEGQRDRSGAGRGDAPGERDRRADNRDEGVAKAVWRNSMEDDVLNVAGGMAYFAFLSLPPTILVLFALTGFFGGEPVADWVTGQLTTLLPEDAAVWIETFVDNVVRSQAPGPFSVGLVLALWAASNVFMAVTRGLNLAYGVRDPRPWVKQRALAIGVMLFFVIFFLIGSASLIMGPQIARALDVFGVATQAWNLVQWILPFLLIVGAFWIAYYVLPARDQKRHTREILIGAVVGTAIWLLASAAFRTYIANFGGYNETYGVLGGIIILLLWLYLTMVVILAGGQLAAELERRANR